jgi:chromosome segregation ATPase
MELELTIEKLKIELKEKQEQIEDLDQQISEYQNSFWNKLGESQKQIETGAKMLKNQIQEKQTIFEQLENYESSRELKIEINKMENVELELNQIASEYRELMKENKKLVEKLKKSKKKNSKKIKEKNTKIFEFEKQNAILENDVKLLKKDIEIYVYRLKEAGVGVNSILESELISECKEW